MKLFQNRNALDLKCSYFKMIMVINNEQIMMKKSLLNLVMRFWTKINLFFAFSSTSFRNL